MIIFCKISLDKFLYYLKTTFKVTQESDLEGATVLIFGRLKRSGNKKWYIKIDGDSPSKFFMKKSS